MSEKRNTLSGNRQISWISNSVTSLSRSGLTVAGFEKAGTSVAMLWYSDQVPRDELVWDRVDVTVKGVSFQNPVCEEMITGKVYELDKSTWTSAGGNTTLTQLPTWDRPMMLAERDQIQLRKDGSVP